PRLERGGLSVPLPGLSRCPDPGPLMSFLRHALTPTTCATGACRAPREAPGRAAPGGALPRTRRGSCRSRPEAPGSGASREPRPCAPRPVRTRHLPLACPSCGSGGAWDDPRSVLPELYPFLGGWSHGEFVGPAWYWNPWQWPLNAWPNALVTVAGLVGWVYV